MSIAALIRGMAAAGAPSEAIALAVEAIEAKDAELAARRAAGAERVRRHRAAKASNGNADVTYGNVTVTAEPLSPAPPFPSPEPLTKTPLTPIPLAKVVGRATAKTAAIRLPSDWEPDELGPKTRAVVDRWRPGELESQLQRFRDHWAASATPTAKKHDWQAAWRTWIGKHNDDRPRNGNGMGGHRAPQANKPGSSRFNAVLDLVAKHGTGAARDQSDYRGPDRDSCLALSNRSR